ncbi:MAG: DUF2312 domain-containing protein [Alphaproteobacteria bacterium]|jgi:uncharacterized protein (UPF0335 family)|nr:DUF2312 domain-containing protein [Alphaproteobacteria bacterium]
MANVVGIAAEQLQQIVSRVERLEEEKKGIADDIKEVYAEAKSNGFDVKIIRNVIKLRKLDRAALREMDEMMQLYREAVEMPVETSGHEVAQDNEAAILLGALAGMVPKSGQILINTSHGGIRITRDRGGKIVAELVTPRSAGKPSDAARGGASGADNKEADADCGGGDGAKPSKASEPAKQKSLDLPDVDEAGAEELGRQYARDGRPVLDNPFPFRDPRQPRFDKGWRAESGSDGMGPKT